ncbi:uncharacterized protein LOC124661047 [Lolium rigidum]|uniref:uncharacterized protein LOC124661047 n=1 Tax=Lolium rigidum TaxID=89674 RepID=UPI001F5D0772|nr:uncharacterized protein LOC124661047 [Lolium rigidum]
MSVSYEDNVATDDVTWACTPRMEMPVAVVTFHFLQREDEIDDGGQLIHYENGSPKTSLLPSTSPCRIRIPAPPIAQVLPAGVEDDGARPWPLSLIHRPWEPLLFHGINLLEGLLPIHGRLQGRRFSSLFTGATYGRGLRAESMRHASETRVGLVHDVQELAPNSYRRRSGASSKPCSGAPSARQVKLLLLSSRGSCPARCSPPGAGASWSWPKRDSDVASRLSLHCDLPGRSRASSDILLLMMWRTNASTPSSIVWPSIWGWNKRRRMPTHCRC